jgi:hypothetical protein
VSARKKAPEWEEFDRQPIPDRVEVYDSGGQSGHYSYVVLFDRVRERRGNEFQEREERRVIYTNDVPAIRFAHRVLVAAINEVQQFRSKTRLMGT